MNGLYTSNFTPRGVRKDWDRCSMDAGSTKKVFADLETWGRGILTEAVAWFTPEGALRVLVADFDSRRRVTIRWNARGGWKLQTEHLPS